jgi:hypothetical protein
VSDCPNCGAQVDPGAALCPNCGFDLQSEQGDTVRRLREEGRIHPGPLGAQAPNEPSEPEQLDAGQ